MKNITNILLGLLVVAVVGLYFKPATLITNTKVEQVAGAVGDTNTSPRMLQTNISLASTTPFSSLNSSGTDRLITSVEYYLGSTTAMNGTSALGVATLNWIMSTSTDQYNATSANYVLNTTIATSSGQVYVSTSTPGNAATLTTRIWANNSYLNLTQNATSTTATPNYIIVHYRQL